MSAKTTAITRESTTVEPEQRICWLGGWGIAEADMLASVQRLLPEAKHRVLLPTAASLSLLREQLRSTAAIASASAATTGAGKTLSTITETEVKGGAAIHANAPAATEIIAGYSTGAFLLLREFADYFLQANAAQPLRLFAPFADFRAESALGGRVVLTRLKLLLRRLRTAPLAAIADFYQQSGIALPPPATLPYPQAELIWGIEQLAETALSEKTIKLIKNTKNTDFKVWIGAGDPLLDACQIASLFASGSCQIAADAAHDLHPLLHAALCDGGFTS